MLRFILWGLTIYLWNFEKNVQINNSNIKTFNLILSDKSENNSVKDPELKFGTYGSDNLEFTENF